MRSIYKKPQLIKALFRNGFVCVLFLCQFSLIAQEAELNQYDAQGKRHGKWKKNYEGTDKLRYEGTFKHGKEVGTFKFYHYKGEDHPSATKTYKPNTDLVEAKFYTVKGKLISEGQFKNKQREGKWTYYHKENENIMTIEHYKNGKLDGERLIYFPSGKLAEKQVYEDDVKSGENLVYAENGNLIQEYFYKDGKMHGEIKIYNAGGDLITQGYYKEGLRDGEWKYYEDGKLMNTEQFPKTVDGPK